MTPLGSLRAGVIGRAGPRHLIDELFACDPVEILPQNAGDLWVVRKFGSELDRGERSGLSVEQGKSDHLLPLVPRGNEQGVPDPGVLGPPARAIFDER